MMKRYFFYLALFFFVGCEQKNEDNIKVTAIYKEMKTHCIGRHLVDFPIGFDLVDGSVATFKQIQVPTDAASIDLVTRSSNITHSEFLRKVQKRRAEIVAAEDETTDILKEVKSLSDDAILFRILQIGDAYISEMHILKGGNYLVITTNSFRNLFLEAESRLGEFAKNIKSVDMQVSNNTGFCLGAVVVQGQYSKEYVTFSFRSRLQPDILISVDIDTYSPDESETLLHRVNGPNSLLKKFDVRSNVLREGDLKIAGMQAQEWLSSTKLGDDRDMKQFVFALETTRSTPSPGRPHIHVDFSTGQQDIKGNNHPNSLNDKEAIFLWDSIIKSIRSSSAPSN
jgi:hypothetical protein